MATHPAPDTPGRLVRTRLRLLLLAALLGPFIMVLLGFAFAWFVRDEPLWAALTRVGPPLRVLAAAAVSAGVSMGLIALLYRTNRRFARALKRSGGRVAEETLKAAGYPVMFAVVIMAGFGEEVLFRGGLQPTLGLIPTAVLFGFSHGGWRREMWAYAVAAAGAGLVFGLAYQLTGELWVPVIGHAIHNVASVLAIGRKLEFTWHRGRLRVSWRREEERDEREGPEED
jgi:membrane protease YdiL (CAAX protease family)